MPPKKSKKTGQADQSALTPAVAVLTPKQITTALTQLMESQHQTQWQIEALLAQQNNPQQAGSQFGAVERAWEPPRTRQRAKSHSSHTKDTKKVINDRRAALEERHNCVTWESS